MSRKLILEKGKNKELYDLINDPGEKQNVLKKFPDTAKDLEGQLLSVLGKVQFEFPEATGSPKIDEETRQKLIKEGYF